jgi:hypothetical protein
VFSAADIIEALGLRRRLKSIRPDTPGQMPQGWQSWLDGMSASERAVRGAPPQSVIDELALRPLSEPPKRVGNLNRWRAFATLWRQQWHPPEREERGVRWFAALFSGVLHLFFALMLLWLAYVRIVPLPAASEGETVVQVEFIGEGTPKETGGGAPQGPKPEPEVAPAPAAAPGAAKAPPQETPKVEPPPPAEPQPPQPPAEAQPVAAQPEPEPAPVEVPPAPQPLQVTEVAQPDTTFVLPPPRPQEATLPQRDIVVPEARAPTERISRVARPVQQRIEIERVPTQTTYVAPALRAEEQARLSQVRALQATPSQAREIRVPAARAQLREIPMPSRGTTPTATQPGTSTGTSPSTAPGSATAPAATAGGQPSPGSGVAPAAQPGTGTTPNAPPGAWPSPKRGDDWGVGTRNRPGGTPGTGSKPGIFKGDGTPNLGEPVTPGRNAPGTLEAHIADLDRAGQWLKRPPYDYAPTTFDKYWIPHETLLQEWVRKGIKTLSIPIPGTNKKLSCVISLLQVGGGCGLVDPDINSQPASARPPPDVPFKPWLQEDNGSVRTPPPGASTSTRPAGASTRALPSGG